ncbi:M20 family metallopeptidase [uncultured Veillonella sp.]|uniref:M20 metallopeptidase family protein n=1 Tax=uncultured Veillonella sp. TaxID=159268 RepID=UPI0026329041|nr:amidohydrolase [uncultured Veillonella sp.]
MGTEHSVSPTVEAVKQLQSELGPQIIEWRRYLHQYPEVSFEEQETTKFLARELDTMGIPYTINSEKNTGIVAWIEGPKPGKTIMLRSDIDALNVLEKTGFDFKSKHEGKMHACGHDGHMSVLLGAAKILKTLQDSIEGKVYLVFQPAEESAEGAEYMKRFGTWYEETDAVFGGHIWIDLPAGKLSVEAGERMAAALEINIEIEGKAGHGAQPHLTVDATVVASAIVMNLQTLVSRHFNPLDSVVVTIGKMTSGTRYNVISGSAKLEGTARYFKPEIGDELRTMMGRMVEDTAHAYGATAKASFRQMVPPTINDPVSSELAHRVGVSLFGEEAVVPMQKTMGGEDFAYYMQDKPGCFAFFGIANPAIDAVHSHHSNFFTIDESALPMGAAMYAQYALQWLQENK